MQYKTVRVVDHEATGKLWRETRKGLGISLRALAKELDVSAAYLSDLERGRRNWTEELETRYIKGLTATGKTPCNWKAPSPHTRADRAQRRGRCTCGRCTTGTIKGTTQGTTGHPETPATGGRGPGF